MGGPALEDSRRWQAEAQAPLLPEEGWISTESRDVVVGVGSLPLVGGHPRYRSGFCLCMWQNSSLR